MQTKLGNLVLDQWVDGDGDGNVLTSAVDGEPVASITSDGLDFGDMLNHARTMGGANLRKLTFHERGEMLKALALYLQEHKKEFYALSTATGATRGDSWVDIDGGISTLFVFSGKGRREMPNDYVYLDGQPEQISKNGTFTAQHIFTPKLGAAVHACRRSGHRKTGIKYGLPDRTHGATHQCERHFAGRRTATNLRQRRRLI